MDTFLVAIAVHLQTRLNITMIICEDGGICTYKHTSKRREDEVGSLGMQIIIKSKSRGRIWYETYEIRELKQCTLQLRDTENLLEMSVEDIKKLSRSEHVSATRWKILRCQSENVGLTP